MEVTTTMSGLSMSAYRAMGPGPSTPASMTAKRSPGRTRSTLAARLAP
jgi:hypothetical protein